MARLNESRASALINDSFGVTASVAMTTTLHSRHGMLVVVGLDAEVTVSEATGSRTCGRAVVAPPDLPYAFTCSGPCVAFLYDPERMPSVAAYARSRDGAFALNFAVERRVHGAVRAHRAALTRPDVLDGLARELADELGSGARPQPLDRRVARVLETLRDAPADERVALPATGLSSSHLRALFARDVGIPIRSFALWRRLLHGLSAFSRVDATRAAHLAGFADLAHFSRTCRRMLGASPTELGRNLLEA
jgi:AraC-like DNA-binding protein